MRKVLAVLLVSGAALAKSEDRQVPAFTGVHISAGIHAEVQIGPQKPVHIEADDAILPLVETVVEDGVLIVRFQRDHFIRNEGRVRLTIQTPELRTVGASGGSIVKAELSRGQSAEVEASGGSEIHARGIDAAQFDGQASGGSVLTLEGNVESAKLQLSGGSQLHGRNFSARDADVHGSGGSQAELKATGKINGSLSGGSQLHVTGGASTQVATSGGSQVSAD